MYPLTSLLRLLNLQTNVIRSSPTVQTDSELGFPRCQFKWAQDAPQVAQQGPWQNKEYQLKIQVVAEPEEIEAALRERARKKASSQDQRLSHVSWHTCKKLTATTLYHHLVHTHVLTMHTYKCTQECVCVYINWKIFSMWYSAIILHEMHWIFIQFYPSFGYFKMWIKTH